MLGLPLWPSPALWAATFVVAMAAPTAEVFLMKSRLSMSSTPY